MFLSMVICPTTVVGAAQSAVAPIRQAQEFLTQGNYVKAREAAQQALAIDPKSAEAEDVIGKADLALGDLAAAEVHLRRALELRPGLVTSRSALAATYMRENRLQDARREFLAVLTADPRNFFALYGVGLICLLDRHAAEAVAYFEQANQLKPSDPAILTHKLQAHLELKQQRQAEAALAELDTQLSPGDPRRSQLAELLVGEGAYGLAINEFEFLHKAHPDSPDLSYNLALAYHRAGREDEASALVKSLLTRNESADLESLLGEVEQGRGDRGRSLAAFRRAADLEPTNEDYRFDYAQALVRDWNLNEAFQVFAQACKEFPKSARMWLGLGATYYLVGKYQAAVETLLHAAEVAPDRPEAYYFLGRAYDAAGLLQDSIAQEFGRYLDTGPRDPWAEYFYGRILALRTKQPQDTAEAQRHLEKAIALDSSLAEAHVELGSILEMRGHFAAARRELEHAVRLDPRSSAAFYKLAQLYRRLGEWEKARRAAETFQRLKAKEPENRDREQIQGFLERVKR